MVKNKPPDENGIITKIKTITNNILKQKNSELLKVIEPMKRHMKRIEKQIDEPRRNQPTKTETVQEVIETKETQEMETQQEDCEFQLVKRNGKPPNLKMLSRNQARNRSRRRTKQKRRTSYALPRNIDEA